jgi:hypothetical protein
MNENPFQSPQAAGMPSASNETLRNVARYQRGVLVCILLQLASIPVNLVLQNSEVPALSLLLSLAVIAVGLVGAVFLFLLAKTLYSTGIAILMAILTILPCIGLLVLLIVNIQATKFLRQNGVTVGLMGADTSKL